MSHSKGARRVETVAKAVTGLAALVALAAVVAIVGYVFVRGSGSISWEFLSQPPRKSMTEGGIWPAILGSILLTAGTALLALPVGVSAGIYLSEYAPRNAATRAIRLAIANMAGVPSIVYGLFGLSLFVLQMQLGKSVQAGALTLACLTLPVVITATEEALRQIPSDLRHASLALGATRLRTITRVILPAAAPGIVTGAVLGLARAAGETAPIMFTAVVFYGPAPATLADPVMALPYHLYIMATQAVKPAPHIVWGTAFVLVFGVTALNVAAAYWRSVQRRKVKW